MGIGGFQKETLRLKGENIELFADRALFWPNQSLLVVSDLHWGKAETFHSHGIPIPETLFESDLARLTKILVHTQAKRLLVLGDVIHSKSGLTEAVIERIGEWRKTIPAEILPIRGNHDRHLPKLPSSWKMEWLADFREGPFYFCHEPLERADTFVWAGHLHPTFSLHSRHDRVRLPCFHLGPQVGVLPAFSEFTRGVQMPHRFGDRIFVLTPESIFEVPPIGTK